MVRIPLTRIFIAYTLLGVLPGTAQDQPKAAAEKTIELRKRPLATQDRFTTEEARRLIIRQDRRSQDGETRKGTAHQLQQRLELNVEVLAVTDQRVGKIKVSVLRDESLDQAGGKAPGLKGRSFIVAREQQLEVLDGEGKALSEGKVRAKVETVSKNLLGEAAQCFSRALPERELKPGERFEISAEAAFDLLGLRAPAGFQFAQRHFVLKSRETLAKTDCAVFEIALRGRAGEKSKALHRIAVTGRLFLETATARWRHLELEGGFAIVYQEGETEVRSLGALKILRSCTYH